MRDTLTRAEREAMAHFSCNVCKALLLLIEIGPHFRVKHPDARPSVSERP